MKRLLMLALSFALFSLMLLGGCIIPPIVEVKVLKPPLIDVGPIKKFAVCPFEGPNGDILAAKLTVKLLEGGIFFPFEQEKVNSVIDEIGLDETEIDQSTAMQIGKTLKAEGVIFGSIDYKVEDSKGEEKVTKYRKVGFVERFVRKRILGEEVSGTEPYKVILPSTTRRAKLTVVFKVVDIKDEKLLTVKSITQSFEQKIIHDPENPPEELKSEDEILDGLIDKVADTFAKQISPYYVTEKKIWEDIRRVKENKVARNYFVNELFTEAGEILDKLMKNPELTPEQLAAIYYNRGLIYECLGNLNEAEKLYEKAASLISSHLHLGALKNIRKKIEEYKKLQEQEVI